MATSQPDRAILSQVTTLYYIHDPMCSWCWGFRPILERLLAGLPAEVRVVRLLGGLAPDSEEPMPEEMRAWLQQTWRKIAARIPGTEFNHDFWRDCVPRRSTYRACRAVISARQQDPALDPAMTYAIQRAYYLQARNPSDRDTLIALAGEIGAEQSAFAAALDEPATQGILDQEMAQIEAIGLRRFPSLVLETNGGYWPIPVDYLDAEPMLAAIRHLS